MASRSDLLPLVAAALLACGGEASGGAASAAAGVGSTGSTGGAGGSAAFAVHPDGVAITAVKIYQAVERPLFEAGGEAASSVPIVAGRDALVRVFYQAATPQEVSLRLALGNAEPIVAPGFVAGTSAPGAMQSTVNATIPAERLTEATRWSVELLGSADGNSGTNEDAAAPISGDLPLPVQSAGSGVRVVLVPIAYGADGSNRLPDTSPEQVERYRRALRLVYPTPTVTIAVREAVPWAKKVGSGGSGWGALLNRISDVRAEDAPTDDTYYYGVFNAADTYDAFCSNGCVLGLSWLAGPDDPLSRVGIGIGFTGDDATSTAVHEIGHAHGRPHAPCGVDDPDPLFPHPDGSIGVWGFNAETLELVAPDRPDFMSYCSPEWVSDYTYTRLFERIQLVNSASWVHGASALHDRIALEPDGTATVLAATNRPMAVQAERLEVEVTDRGGGRRRVEGTLQRYTHADGGTVFVPRGPRPPARFSFVWAGRRVHVDP